MVVSSPTSRDIDLKAQRVVLQAPGLSIMATRAIPSLKGNVSLEAHARLALALFLRTNEMHSDHADSLLISQRGAKHPLGATISRISVLMHNDSSVRIRQSPYDNSVGRTRMIL